MIRNCSGSCKMPFINPNALYWIKSNKDDVAVIICAFALQSLWNINQKYRFLKVYYHHFVWRLKKTCKYKQWNAFIVDSYP